MENSKNNDFFNSLNEGFEDFSENPPTIVWEGIEFDLAKKQLAKDKKRFFWLHYSSLFIIAFFISFGVYQLFNYSSKSLDGSSLAKNRVLKDSETLRKNVISEETEIVKKETLSNTGSDKVDNNDKYLESLNVKSIAKNSTINDNKIVSVELMNLSETVGLNSQISQAKKEADSNLLSNSEITNNKILVENISDTTKTITRSLEQAENSSIAKLEDTNRVEITLAKTDSIQNNNSDISTLPKENKKLASRFSVGIFFSPDYANRLLSSNNEGEFDNDVEQINNQEKPKFAYSYGLRFGFDLTNKLTINTGFTYSFIRQSYMPTNLDIDTTGDDDTRYSYLSSSGIVEFSSNDFEYEGEDQNSGEEEDSINLSYQANEKLNFISIPLFMRQQVSSKKTKVFAIYGLSANILTSKELNIQVLDSPKNAIVNQKHINNLKRANFGFILGIGFERKLYRNFNFFMEPTIKCSFTSMNKKDFVKSYPYSLGLSTGISYHF